MTEFRLPSLNDVERAREMIEPYIEKTPLIKLRMEGLDREIYLKLENFQPTGSFKVRPAYNSILSLPEEKRRAGVCTISSGNMALGVAAAARHLGVPMAAYLYRSAPKIKIQGIRDLGGEVRFLSEDQWQRCVHLEEEIQARETMIHPVVNESVLAGNGTMGAEIVEEMPDVDAVLIPYGGGACSIGVGAVVKSLQPDASVIAVEGEHASPLSMALKVGKPVKVEIKPSFVKSIGGVTVFDEILGFAADIIDDVSVVSLDAIAEAVRILFRKSKIVVEGAGAASVSAAILDKSLSGKKVVCLITGGNIDAKDYAKILQGY